MHIVKTIKQLPDAEFEVMKVVWANNPPITTGIIMEQLGKEKKWKAQTINSLLLRLVKRGFLLTEKKGKERIYISLICKEDYLKFETSRFIKQYHDDSLLNLVNTLYNNKSLDEREIEELLQWVKERRG